MVLCIFVQSFMVWVVINEQRPGGSRGWERKERLEVGGDETEMSGFFIEMGAKNVEPR